MRERDAPLGESAGPRELHEVAPKDFEHFAAHEPHDERRLKDAERKSGKQNVPQSVRRQKARRPEPDRDGFSPPEGGKESRHDAEDHDEENADQEGRKRHPEKRGAERKARENAFRTKRRKDPDRDSRDERDQDGEAREFHRRGETLENEVRHGRAVTKAHPEVSRESVSEKPQILHEGRIVETERLRERRAVRGRCVGRKHLRDGVAHELKEREGDAAHDEKDEQALQNPLGEKSKHGHFLIRSPAPDRARACCPDEGARRPTSS